MINNKSNDDVAVIYSNKIYRYNWIYENVLAHKDNIFGTSGENIGLFIQNSIDYVVAYFAISFADKVIVPIETNGKAWQILSTMKIILRILTKFLKIKQNMILKYII